MNWKVARKDCLVSSKIYFSVSRSRYAITSFSITWRPTRIDCTLCSIFQTKIKAVYSCFKLSSALLRDSKRILEEQPSFRQPQEVSTCELDPCKTWLLKSCPIEIVPMYTQIVRLSLQSYPRVLSRSTVVETAHVRPLLKKPHLNPEDFSKGSIQSSFSGQRNGKGCHRAPTFSSRENDFQVECQFAYKAM